jgi:hypothetical protein
MQEPIMRVGKWEVRQMVLTPHKVERIWKQLQQYKTLFSDLTAGDYNGWVSYITNPYTYWLEIYDEVELVGVIYLEDMERVIDAEAHVMFFDRRPAEKKEVCFAILDHIFETFPMLNRITLNVPIIYWATQRLAKDLGFTREGVRRRSLLFRGRYLDLVMFGLLRSEAHERLHGKAGEHQHNSTRYSRTARAGS